jgi:hypothetical protein
LRLKDAPVALAVDRIAPPTTPAAAIHSELWSIAGWISSDMTDSNSAPPASATRNPSVHEGSVPNKPHAAPASSAPETTRTTRRVRSMRV